MSEHRISFEEVERRIAKARSDSIPGPWPTGIVASIIIGLATWAWFIWWTL